MASIQLLQVVPTTKINRFLPQ